ncbi:MAG: methionyl-tRNA formyltransferase [Pyrinomonadaceae bacterium]
MKIVFMGTPEAAVPCLSRLVADGHEICDVWTQPDRPSGRGKKLKAPAVKIFAEDNGLRVFQPTKIKTKESRERFSANNADVAVVVAYGRILPESYLSAFEFGAINVHFSLLPKYRGAAPVNWAIANGETTTGVTTMLMDTGLDTGDILKQMRVEILSDETAPSLMNRLSEVGAELLSETISDFHSILPRKQEEAEASFAPLFEKSDGLVDWSLPAVEIVNRIRGFQPFPGSFSYLKGKRVILWDAKAVANAEGLVAGQVGRGDGKGVVVGCGGETCVEIHALQLEGKARSDSAAFKAQSGIEAGDFFCDDK